MGRSGATGEVTAASGAAGSIDDVNDVLNIRRFGPQKPAQILLIHGLTGHGQRWETLATQHLPEYAILAPDLIGHGRSTWAAPWTIDANVAALAGLLDADAQGPVWVVGHSFGGALALNLASARPELVAGLVLLDPAVGLDGDWMREIADAMLASPTSPTAPRRGPTRRRVPGVRSRPRNWNASSTSTSSTCRTAGSAGGSAFPP